MTTFADWVSTTAKGFGYKTDAALAQAIGVQQSTVTRWRQGNQPQIKHLVALAYLFRMRIDPLLAMSEHVPADLLSDADPPGPPMTESVRHIRDASLSDNHKEALTRYWDQRLNEERQKLYRLISYLEQSEEAPKQAAGDELLHMLRLTVQTHAGHHLTELVEATMSVEASLRKRRRRGSRLDDLAEIYVESDLVQVVTDEGNALERKDRRELEP
ncbi:hypothetical protein [Nonomuraea sp. NPDC049158]|uniref:hypothetical protein n=1 Tax=Nonomuraea sp. NPDC049158 TaxID=3155649 RepID=UPI0033C2481C